ncbi:MAG: ribonuclease HIII [Erysipelotrichaceae bacterium]|nr:ribonuclease HIII [Erysipelotrichaceae bacterium]
MTITVKITEETKKAMDEFYKDLVRPKTPQYALFQADDGDTVVTLYESGKAVFQGKDADLASQYWIETEKINAGTVHYTNSDEKGKKEKKEIKKDMKLYNATTIGSDEVGTGDYFGPIVVTACYVNKENKDFLEELGVRDSKKLTDEKILEIVPKIVRVIPYNTVILNNKEYNSRYSSNINMNAIKAIMHNKVLSNISKEHNDFEYAVVDQFTYPNAYFSYLKNCSNIFRNITFLTKAEDQVLSVACASIISRYVFIKEMAKISKELGILIPKGASTAVDEVALKIASEKGFDVLTNYVKLNFKNTEKVKELLKNA